MSLQNILYFLNHVSLLTQYSVNVFCRRLNVGFITKVLTDISLVSTCVQGEEQTE